MDAVELEMLRQGARRMLSNRDRAIRTGRCVQKPIGCGRTVDPSQWDEVTQREYGISGLCRTCQDKIFGEES
jgi:hypothetical protein